MKRLFLLINLIVMMMCATRASACNPTDSIVSVSAPAFEKEMKSPSVQLLDVRTPEEFAEGHIAGARNIDVLAPDFEPKAAAGLKKDAAVLVYCRSGRRSMDAAVRLARLGYRVVNLAGGIMEWQERNLPVTQGDN